MKQDKILRAALLALAMLFLAIAWIWDGLIAIARLIVGLIPWTRLKQALIAIVDRLPAPLVLLIFLVPFLIVEPLLVVATVAIAMGYVVAGAIAWIILKLLAIAVIPAIFDLTQHRLMTMPWFVRAYRKVMAFHDYAHAIVAPYKHAAAAMLREWRHRAMTALAGLPGAELAAHFFALRKRSTNGRPRLPLNL
jgi:hypothetical protein